MTVTQLKKTATACLLISLALFVLFFANVFAAGPLGLKPWLDDLQEMLLLFASVTFFVFGTLAKEAIAKVPDGLSSPDT